MAHILLVEDDDAIRSALVRALGDQGQAVTAVRTGGEAIATAVATRPDVVLLDLGLPDLDGSTVLTMIRAVSDLPVIVTTARDDEREIVRLLDAGADDYVVKPFSAPQVLARVRAVIRRSTAVESEGPLVVGHLSVDPRTREVKLAGQSIELTRKEFDLLLTLARHEGEVVSKRELLAQVWQLPWGGADRTVDVHLSWLRRKLGESAAEPRYLRSVRGVGIRLVVPEDEAT